MKIYVHFCVRWRCCRCSFGCRWRRSRRFFGCGCRCRWLACGRCVGSASCATWPRVKVVCIAISIQIMGTHFPVASKKMEHWFQKVYHRFLSHLSMLSLLRHLQKWTTRLRGDALPKLIRFRFLHVVIHLWIFWPALLCNMHLVVNRPSVTVGFGRHVLHSAGGLFQSMIGSGQSGPGFECCLHLILRVPW